MNQNIPLFPDEKEFFEKKANTGMSDLRNYSDIKTEGIKYAGSKLKIIPSILQMAEKVGARTIFDGFSGTTRVSQAFYQSGYSVISNDSSVWSEIFATCYLKANKSKTYYEDLICHLNSITPFDGWFTENYGGFENNGNSIQSDGLKKPWQIHNTRKLDGIRNEIDSLKLDSIDKSVAITSLILALDKVDNTLGHFTSYLRDWSARSYNNIELKLPKIIFGENNYNNMVIRGDIFSALDKVTADLSYFDPPYGSNNEKMPPSRVRYRSYYHIWTTICLNDEPELFGKAKRRKDSSDSDTPSVFEEYRKNDEGKFIAVKSIEKLIKETRSRWLILSYSSGGRATAEDLNSAMKDNGKLVDILEIDHRRNVMSNMKWTNEWLKDAQEKNREFLFLLDKEG